MLKTLNSDFVDSENTLKLLNNVGVYSKTWSDTFRSVLIFEKEQEPRKHI